MKRLFALVLIALLFPQVTFAAWWNPTSWKVFKKDDTQVLQNRIEELEKKLENFTSQASTSSSPQEIKKDVPKSFQQSDKLKTETKIIKVVATFSGIVNDYKIFQSEVDKEKKSYKKNSKFAAEKNYYKYLEQLLVSISADLGYLYQIEHLSQKPAGILATYSSKLDTLKSDYPAKRKLHLSYIKEDQKNYENNIKEQQKQVEISNKKELESLCIRAKSAYKIANDEKFERTEKYNTDVKSIKSVGYMTQEAQNGLLYNLYENYNSDITPMNIEIEKARVDMKVYCE